jgi:hypothetical protein
MKQISTAEKETEPNGAWAPAGGWGPSLDLGGGIKLRIKEITKSSIDTKGS